MRIGVSLFNLIFSGRNIVPPQRDSSVRVYGARALQVQDPRAAADFWSTREREQGVHYLRPTLREGLRARVDWLVPSKGHVLDIMCGTFSYVSRLPGRVIHGIGTTPESLSENSALSSFSIQDINDQPVVSYHSPVKAVVISLGAPYMTKPLEFLSSIYDLLPAGGKVILLFANDKGDDSKTTNLWLDPRNFGFDDRDAVARDYLEKTGFSVKEANLALICLNLEFFGNILVGTKPRQWFSMAS